MNKEVEKYSIDKLYLKEFQFYNGEYDITLNIVDINTDKMIINLAVSNLGKISVIEYDLKRDKDNNLYIEFGCENSKIEIDDFEEIN
ncbi:MAG: hypothetical protein IKM43_01135 [Clostridia bacterium]|nr:hypothetical protein [Clostridia bacterium]